MATPLSFEYTSKILGDVKIPSAPAVYMELHEQMQQDEPDIQLVADVISRDPGLAALVLKTVNSPFFQLRSPVRSIRQAAILLGLMNIGNIVAGLALRRAMEDAGGPAPDHYWDTPVNVGNVAARLVQQFDFASSDEAYMLGLFHDVGVPLMMQRFPDYLQVMQSAAEQGMDVIAVEDRHYQTNHAVIGYLVSRNWGLPREVGELILRHHDVAGILDESGGQLTRAGVLLSVLKIAEHVDQRFWGRSEGSGWASWGDRVLSYLGLCATDFEDIVDDMLELLNSQ